MEPLTIAIAVALAALVAAVILFAAHFARGRAKVGAVVEAAEAKSFQTVVSHGMLAWKDEMAKRAQAIAVQQGALEADRAAFAATQRAIAAMSASDAAPQP